MKNVLMIVSLFVAVSVVILTSIVSLQCSSRSQPATTPAASGPASQPATAAAPAAPAPAGPSMADASAKAHEQLAIIALSDVKVLVARKEYDQASKLAQEALRQYVDTPLAGDFQQLAESAAAQAQAQKEALASQAAQSQEELQARHERFVAYRDQALAAYNAGDFPNAIVLFQNALREESDAQAQAMLDQAVARVSKPHLAVLDFTAVGDFSNPNIGRAVAELLLTRIDPQTFQLVERSRLAELLARQGLTVGQLGNNPQVLQGEGLAIVRFLVMGSIVRTDNVVTLSGRLVDAQSGQIVNTAQVRVNSPADLPPAVGELAAMLQMSPEQKAQYLQDKQQADQQAAAAQQEAAQARQQAEAQAWGRHLQAGSAALNQVRGLLAAGDLYNAAMLSRQYAGDYSDTPMARDFVDVLATAEAGMSRQGYQGGIIIVGGGYGAGWGNRGGGEGHGGHDGGRGDATRPSDGHGGGGETRPGGHEPGGPPAGGDHAGRHEQFLKYQREGKQDMAARDWSGAIGNFNRALAFEDDGEVRRMLQVCTQQQEQARKRQAQYEDVMLKGGRAEAAGQWVLAMRYYEQAYALNPSDAAKEALARAKAKAEAPAAKENRNRPQATGEIPAAPSQPVAKPPMASPVSKPPVEPVEPPAVKPTVILPGTKPSPAAEPAEEKPAEPAKPPRILPKESTAVPISPAPLVPAVPPSPVGPPAREPTVAPAQPPAVPPLPNRPPPTSEPAKPIR